MKEKNNNMFAYLAIVSIVAILGIFMIANGVEKTATAQRSFSMDLGNDNLIGDARAIGRVDRFVESKPIEEKPIIPSECFSSDGGFNFYEAGYTKTRTLYSEDYCSNNKVLEEYGCGNKEYWSNFSKNLNYSATIFNVDIRPINYDNERKVVSFHLLGDVIKIRIGSKYEHSSGLVIYPKNVYYDLNNNTIIEFFVRNTHYYSMNHVCESGCEDGACVPYKKLNIDYGFEPNMGLAESPHYTIPEQGSHTYEEGSNASLNIGTNIHPLKFIRWEITKNPDNALSSYSESYNEEHLLVMNEDYDVTAVFGCASDDACETGYVCEDSVCVEKQNQNMSLFFSSYVSDGAPASDVALLTQIISSMSAEGLIPLDVYEGLLMLFSEFDYSEIDNKVSLVIYRGKAAIIIGETSPPDHFVFGAILEQILISRGISSDNIKHLSSSEINSNNLYELFEK